ncbi:hypothetical protein BLA29_014931, partial [Euroglyphus maynei]
MHLFHEECIIQWFKSISFLFTCPVCRIKIHCREELSKKWSIPQQLLELEKQTEQIQPDMNNNNNDDDDDEQIDHDTNNNSR